MVEVRRMFYRTYRRPAALTIEPGFRRGIHARRTRGIRTGDAPTKRPIEPLKDHGARDGLAKGGTHPKVGHREFQNWLPARSHRHRARPSFRTGLRKLVQAR